jgi:adenylylsulfate kinase
MFVLPNKQACIKLLTWRFAGSAVTFGLVYVFSGSPVIAASLCAIEIAIKLVLYALHEAAWSRYGTSSRQAARPFVLWFTGLSGSGKSTLANRIHDRLAAEGHRATRLDGDTVRAIFPETGFSRDERNNHIRRIGYLASILEKNGVIVISSFVSPYAESRNFVRSLCDNFVEIYVATSLEECERRDVKGLYRKARAGDIRNFTGIDDPYEPPEHPELAICTDGKSVDESMREILTYLNGYLLPVTRNQ